MGNLRTKSGLVTLVAALLGTMALAGCGGGNGDIGGNSVIPLAVGNSWEMKGTMSNGQTDYYTLRISATSVFNGRMTYSMTQSGSITYVFANSAGDLYAAGVLGAGEATPVIPTSPVLLTPANLTVGQSVDIQNFSGGLDRITVVAQGVSVDVPAGHFSNAFQVKREEFYNGHWTKYYVTSIVPGIGVVKGQYYDLDDGTIWLTEELNSYHLN